MSCDTEAYTRDLYGPGGPKYDPAFLEANDAEGEGEGEEEAAGEFGSEDSASISESEG